MERKRTVRLKRRTKRRKTMATERLTRWRRRSRATGTSCSTCPRLLPVRNTSSWSSPVILKSSPHTLMIFLFHPFRTFIYSYYSHSPLQPTLQPSTTAWKRNWGATLPEPHQSRGVEAARLPSSHRVTWVLSLVRRSLTSSQSSPSWQTKHSSRCSLSNRNDHLLSGICVHGAHAEHFHNHSEDPEKGDGHQEREPALRVVPRPAWVPPAAQQPSTGVCQICLPGT